MTCPTSGSGLSDGTVPFIPPRVSAVSSLALTHPADQEQLSALLKKLLLAAEHGLES
jgi:hypothetical protein